MASSTIRLLQLTPQTQQLLKPRCCIDSECIRTRLLSFGLQLESNVFEQCSFISCLSFIVKTNLLEKEGVIQRKIKAEIEQNTKIRESL